MAVDIAHMSHLMAPFLDVLLIDANCIHPEDPIFVGESQILQGPEKFRTHLQALAGRQGDGISLWVGAAPCGGNRFVRDTDAIDVVKLSMENVADKLLVFPQN